VVSLLKGETSIRWLGGLCDSQRRDGIEHRTELILFDFKVISSLKVHPESLARPEELRQAECRIGADPALAMDDLINPARWDTDRDGHVVLSDPQRLEKVGHQDLAWVDWWHQIRHCFPLSGSP